MNVRLKTASGIISDFFARNKKAIICFSIVFVLGITVGIIVEVNANGGEFERVYQNDVYYGAVKVFFFSALLLACCYFVIAVATVAKKLYFIAVIPFFAVGLYFGRYMCVLVGCYGGAGVVNLIFIYVPFFVLAFICMLLAGALGLLQADYCECERGAVLRPSVFTVLKYYGVNIAANFVIFLIIGAITKVIVVGL